MMIGHINSCGFVIPMVVQERRLVLSLGAVRNLLTAQCRTLRDSDLPSLSGGVTIERLAPSGKESRHEAVFAGRFDGQWGKGHRDS